MKFHDVEKYVSPVFRFCLRRLDSVDDAHDLAQEILCEAIAGWKTSQPANPDAWLWRIARNRYCRFIRYGKAHPVLLDDGGLLETVCCEPAEDLSAEKQAVFDAVHTLAAEHRSIMIDFYVHQLSCEQIAAKHALPPSTVRSRLFYGRDKLRKRWLMKMEENRIYSPQEWFLTGNGDVDSAQLERQVVRSIAAACYERPLSIEEISLQTGIPCLYVEDELPNLLNHEIVEKRGERYLTSFVIYREAFSRQAEALLLRHVPALAECVQTVLDRHAPAIRAIGFYGNDLPRKRLWWSLVPMLMREACTQVRMQNPELIRGAFPPRKDGSRGWLCAYATPRGARKYFSGCNAYYLEGSRFRYYWSQEWFCSGLNQLLRRLEEIPAADFPPFFDEHWLAECIRYDLAVSCHGQVRWNTPVFTGAQAEKLKELLSEMAAELIPLLLPAANALHVCMKAEIPSRLHHQIRGIFGIEFNSLIDMTCRRLMQMSVLETPVSKCYAGQVIMLASRLSSFKL